MTLPQFRQDARGKEIHMRERVVFLQRHSRLRLVMVLILTVATAYKLKTKGKAHTEKEILCRNP